MGRRSWILVLGWSSGAKLLLAVSEVESSAAEDARQSVWEGTGCRLGASAIRAILSKMRPPVEGAILAGGPRCLGTDGHFHSLRIVRHVPAGEGVQFRYGICHI